MFQWYNFLAVFLALTFFQLFLPFNVKIYVYMYDCVDYVLCMNICMYVYRVARFTVTGYIAEGLPWREGGGQG